MTWHRARPYLAYLLVVVVSVAGGIWSANTATSRSRNQLEVVAIASAQQQRENTVAGCGRTNADRLDAIKGWSEARRARLATARNHSVTTSERLTAAAAAAVYQDVIRSYRTRLVDCSKAFPPVNSQLVHRALEEITR